MQPGHRWLGVAAGLLAAGLISGSVCGDAQAQAALTGACPPPTREPMEGVLVSAKKDGSSITTTVVTDEKGRYSFPAGRLEPGHYTISDPRRRLQARRPEDRRRRRRRRRQRRPQAQHRQESSCRSSPAANGSTACRATDKQKAFLTMCVGCHTLQRVLTSPHNADEFEQVFLRMCALFAGRTPTHPQPLLPGPRGERPRVTGDAAKAAAEYLASVSLGNAGRDRISRSRPLPRPKGRATQRHHHRIRPAAQRGDAARRVVDADGQAWYSDFGNQFVGVLDPEDRQGDGHRDPGAASRSSRRAASTSSSIRDGNLWLVDDVPGRRRRRSTARPRR